MESDFQEVKRLISSLLSKERASARQEGRDEAVDYIEENCILEPFVENIVETARKGGDITKGD